MSLRNSRRPCSVNNGAAAGNSDSTQRRKTASSTSSSTLDHMRVALLSAMRRRIRAGSKGSDGSLIGDTRSNK
jgi:hypothetical protein